MTTKIKALEITMLTLISMAACKNDEGDTAVPPPQPPKEYKLPPDTVPPIASMKKLRWLKGEWQAKTRQGVIYETWKEVDDTTLAGEGGMMNGKDAIASETISLQERKGEILYIPTVKNQNQGQPVVFQLKETADDSFVFVNISHDFPSRIVYIQKSKDSLEAKLVGTINGKKHEEIILMKRTKK